MVNFLLITFHTQPQVMRADNEKKTRTHNKLGSNALDHNPTGLGRLQHAGARCRATVERPTAAAPSLVAAGASSGVAAAATTIGEAIVVAAGSAAEPSLMKDGTMVHRSGSAVEKREPADPAADAAAVQSIPAVARKSAAASRRT